MLFYRQGRNHLDWDVWVQADTCVKSQACTCVTRDLTSSDSIMDGCYGS